MPYSNIGELPDPVKERYSPRCQKVFMDAFNRAQDNGQDEASCMKVAHTAAGMCKESGKAEALKATVLDDDRFALRAIPFGGPIPSPYTPLGVDLDGEFFSPNTDIKADWFDVRIVDWHHGNDPLFRRATIGKADNLREEEDGWWVDVWLKHGERRLELIRRLAERGAQIFGSSESMPGMVKKASTGEILVWPYIRQTLSTSPQNTHSVLRPLKAVLEGTTPTSAFWSDIEASLRDLGSDLRLTSLGDDVAKAGRMLSEANMKDMAEAMDALQAALERLQGVVKRQPDYSAGREPASERTM